MRLPSLFGVCIALVLSGCGGDSRSTPDSLSQQGRQTVVQLEEATVEAHLKFTFNMLQQLDGDANLCFSPLSLGVALGMALNGASGETFDAIARALGYDKLSLEPFNRQAQQLARLLSPADPDVQVHLANSLWVQRDFELSPQFLRALLTYYESRVETVDFRQPQAAADTINRWVKEQTRDLIEKLFEPDAFKPETCLALVNTLYFEGKWQHPFDRAATTEAPFYLENGQTKRVPMMHLPERRLPYLRGEDFEAVALPYGKGDYQFYLFLPANGQSITEFRKRLTPENWRKWTASFKPTPGTVRMPRFKLEALYDLQKPLTELGMGIAFQRGAADFTNMANVARGELFIDKAVQKAVVEVDEEGTKAAAATGLTLTLTSVPVDRFELIADRPFLFAIVHQPTGTVLFIGIVREP
ncbi:MAG: serpin family protein [Fimbriimonadales bacterium]|nr:serpin family protein [Fimbriimonadales bacterium]